MDHDLTPRPVEAPPGEIDPADYDRQHIVEIMSDPAGQLADGFHLLDLAQLGFGRLALDRFGLEGFVGGPQLSRSVGDGMFEREAALIFALGLPPGCGILAERLDRHRAKHDSANSGHDPEPAEIIGQPIGAGREELRLGDVLLERGAFAVGNFHQLGGERRPRRGLGRSIIEVDRGRAILARHGARCGGKLSPTLRVQLFQLVDAVALRRVARDQPVELVDLLAGKAPLAVVDIAAGPRLLVEHEGAQRRLRAEQSGVDVAGQQVDVIGMALGIERRIARLVRHRDQHDHRDQDQRGDKCPRRCPATAPVKPGVVP